MHHYTPIINYDNVIEDASCGNSVVIGQGIVPPSKHSSYHWQIMLHWEIVKLFLHDIVPNTRKGFHS